MTFVKEFNEKSGFSLELAINEFAKKSNLEIVSLSTYGVGYSIGALVVFKKV